MDYNTLLDEINRLEVLLADARCEIRCLLVQIDDLEGELHRLERYGN